MRLGLQVNHGCVCGDSIAIAVQLKLQNMCRMQQTFRLLRAAHAFVSNGCQGDQQEFRFAFWLPAKPLSDFMQNTLAEGLQVSRTLHGKNCQTDVGGPEVLNGWPPQESAGGKDYQRRDGNPGPAVYRLTVKNSKNLLGGGSFFWKGRKAGADSISPNSRQLLYDFARSCSQRRVANGGFRNGFCPGHNFMENYSECVNVRGRRGRAVPLQFRRHVAGSAAYQISVSILVDSEAEISDDSPKFFIFSGREDYVGGLQIQVEDTATMSFSQSGTKLAGKIQGLIVFQLAT